ncbi:helix-turn-helix transcriptional regulator [Mammaliicoccus sp. D-M17]|uniref:helix-turn-helix domain-containing protein n=1 Tax=Mammaliicoccus sp. D-M17 TaxID=2898677 RepID=UPI001EFB9DA6|nr:helix-turn-helix transcriptional regulator [Mammaliicoccus sp. D-M17]
MSRFRLKKIMKSKGLKISDLNKATGISRNTLSLLINGKSQGIQFNTLYKISETLDVSIGELFEEVNKNEIYEKAKKLDEITEILKKTHSAN